MTPSTSSTTTTLFDDDDRNNKKIDIATASLRPHVNASLYKRSIKNKDNALMIADYIISMKSEINPSDHYKTDVIKLLRKLSIFCYVKDKHDTIPNDHRIEKRPVVKPENENLYSYKYQ